MRRRKFRERRTAWSKKWLQRELEASGDFLHPPRSKRPAPAAASKSFSDIAVRSTAPPKPRRRERPQEVRAPN